MSQNNKCPSKMSEYSFPKDVYDISKKLTEDEFMDLCEKIKNTTTDEYSKDGTSLLQRLEFINYARYVLEKPLHSTEKPSEMNRNRINTARSKAIDTIYTKRREILDVIDFLSTLFEENNRYNSYYASFYHRIVPKSNLLSKK